MTEENKKQKIKNKEKNAADADKDKVSNKKDDNDKSDAANDEGLKVSGTKYSEPPGESSKKEKTEAKVKEKPKKDYAVVRTGVNYKSVSNLNETKNIIRKIL